MFGRVTKYLNSSFSSPANSKKYRDGWDRIFGNKCEKCDGEGVVEVHAEDGDMFQKECECVDDDS